MDLVVVFKRIVAIEIDTTIIMISNKNPPNAYKLGPIMLLITLVNDITRLNTVKNVAL